MKKFLLSFLAASLCCGAAYAEGGNSVILGVGDGASEWSVDTTFHAKVGPGTTQTSLRLWNGTNGLNIFYLTIDLTTENLTMRAVCAKDKVAGNATVTSMSSTHSTETSHYFVGSNGDFYTTAGNATNGSSIVGTPTNAMTVDREVYRTSDRWRQFAYDIDGKCYITRLDYTQGTATFGDQTVPFKVINNDSKNNAVSLYTSKWYGSTNQQGNADNCSEVTAKLVEGENFWAGCAYKLEVTSEPSRTGDLAIPDGGFVIHGRGSGDTFVASLKPGDIVTFDNITMTEEGQQIYPACVVSGNPKNVGGGEWLDTENERGDASERHPRTGIGFNTEQTKLVLMVIDGRTGVSIGVPTGDLGKMLMYAGCDEGMNLDGGGSSTLFTESLGVRNHCSDGKERSVSNAIFAVLEAPEDNEVAELGFYDYSITLPHLGMYTPQIFSFNKYGLSLSTDFKDYTLSCPPELGEIINDGKTLYVTGSGCHALTATFGDASVSIPVTVGQATEATLVYPSVIIDDKHTYTIRLYSTVNYNQIDLNPTAFTWASADANIATVNEEGIIKAASNGTTEIIGKLGELEVSQKTVVENPVADITPFATADSIANWSVSKTSISDISMAALENGVQIEYTVSSTRGTKATVTANDFSYGIPTAIRFRVNPGDATIKSLTVNMRAANSNDLVKAEFETIPSDVETTVDVVIADHFDVADMGIYPLELVSFSISLGDKSKTSHTIKIPGIEAVYTELGGIENILSESAESLKVTVSDGVAHLAVPAKAITVVDLYGRVVAEGEGDAIVLPQGKGILLLIADGKAAKIVR